MCSISSLAAQTLGPLDRQLIAMGLVEMFGTAICDEDFYGLQTVGDVLERVLKQAEHREK
jgi:hypothetical protein